MLANRVPDLSIVSLADPKFRSAITCHLSLGPPETHSDLYIWSVTDAPADGTLVQCANGKQLRLDRYLDRFHLALPDDDEEREQLVTEFFEWIADEYGQLIDCDRNIENIDNLCHLLQRCGVGKKGQLLLDFGCGTGLAARSSGCGQATIVGFDQSPTMRQIARRAGMTVWSHADLARQPPGAIDGAFASYVFHTATGAGSVRLVVARMVPDGFFTVNFHKERGRDWADKLLQSLGMHTILEEPGDTARHGSYVVYGR